MGLRGGAGHRAAREDDSNPLHDATWLYSYADLMTQLLIFAILMLSVLGVTGMPEEKKKEQSRLQQTVSEVEKFVKESGLEETMTLDRGADRLIIRMKSAILFAEGQATLTPDAEKALAGLAPVLVRADSHLRVEGHTDDVPIRSQAFPSNWELSTARAISVTRYLEERGLSTARLSAAGYGQFHPLAPNSGAASRARNRRVEIVVTGG